MALSTVSFVRMLSACALLSSINHAQGACNDASSSNWTPDVECCTSDSPCTFGNGDCDEDEDCAGDLVCGIDNCYLVTPSVTWPAPGTTWDCCVPEPEADNSYLLSPQSGEKRTFDDARDWCRENGADLVSIRSATENEAVAEYLKTRNPPATHAWIGLHDKTSEGEFQWTDGTTWIHQNWGANEPNNYKGDEDCVEIIDGVLNDISCDKMNPFVCKHVLTMTTIDTITATVDHGCYRDDENVFPYVSSPEELTIESCIELCGGLEYIYAGVKNGDKCYCGNNHDYDQHGESSDCNMPCGGDLNSRCGGRSAIQVYSTIEAFDDGCYNDISGDVLPFQQEGSGASGVFPYLTRASCAALCARSYVYAGVRNGNQCFCGDSYDQFAEASNTCDKPCSGDSNSRCGGSSAIQVFLISRGTQHRGGETSSVL